jgi:serine/threonine protein kinase/tetratricopeptide (TPR) repeat protein
MTDAERWIEIERLYHAALERQPNERRSFVEQACAQDQDLRRELESLLAHDAPDDDFLDSPAIDVAARDLSVDETEHASLQPGSLIGAYKIVERIAHGGMGIVYRAEQQHPVRRPVALKIIKPGMDSEQVIARFEAERQALALMDHPNIARVLDAGATSSGRLYFVMELVDGVPVTEYCEKHELDLRDRLALFIPICHAIQHAHQKGVIHRDIKPSNILVTVYDGIPTPKVIDFGIAKAMQEQLTERSMHTQVGAVIGTLEYMSPEQAGSSGEDIDTRSDVYALGAVLYELITGTTPLNHNSVEHSSEFEVIRRIRDESPPPPSVRLGNSKLSRTVRGDLDWVVMKALEKDRARRYASVSALGDDIENYLHGAPVVAGPPSTAYRLKKMAQRHQSVVGTVAAILVLLVAGVAISTREAIRARRAELESAAVNQFLQDGLLAQASANVQAASSSSIRPDPDLKVRTALDRAAARIDGRFPGQPLVEASIRQTIGSTYLDLGLFAEAQRQLEAAARLRGNALGASDALTLESNNLLAVAYLKEFKINEAETLCRNTLALRRKVLGERHPDTLTSLHNLAEVEVALGKETLAEQLYEQVVDLRREVLGEEHPDTLKSMYNLGVLLVRLEKFDRAVQVQSRTLEVRRRVLGNEHPDTMDSITGLAQAYDRAGQIGKAEPLLREALAWQRRALGESSLVTLQTYNFLGQSLTQEGKFQEGEQVLSECVERASRAFGPQHPAATGCMNNLANSLCAEGRALDAEPYYRKVLEGDTRTEGAESGDALRDMSNLAISLGLAGKFGEAESLFDRAIALRKRILGPKHPKTLASMDARARMLQQAGRYAEAEQSYRQVAALRVEVLGAKHANTRHTFLSLAEVLLAEHKYADAVAMIGNPFTGNVASGEERWMEALRQSLLGESLAGLGRLSDAAPLLESGLAELQKSEAQIPLLFRPERRGEADRARQRLLAFDRKNSVKSPNTLTSSSRTF